MSATTIAFRCTQCNKSLRAPIESAGKTATCTGCGGTVPIPEVQDSAWPPGLAPKPQPPAPAAPAAPLAPVHPTIPVARPVHPSTAKSAPPQKQIPVAAPAPVTLVKPASSPPTIVPAHPQTTSPAQPPLTPGHVADLNVPVSSESAPLTLDLDDFELDLPPTPPARQLPAAPPTSLPPTSRRRRRQVEVGEILSRTWQIFKSNVGSLVGLVLLMLFFMGTTGGVITVTLKALGIVDLTDAKSVDGWQSLAARHLIQGLALFFILGGFNYLVNLARGRDASLGDLYSAGGIYPSGLIVWVALFPLMLLMGLALAQLELSAEQTSIIAGLSSMAFSYFVWLPFLVALADRQSNPIDALQHSTTFLVQHFLTLLVLSVVSLCILIVSLLACGIGLLVGMPFVLLLLTVAYTSNMREN
jgi:hypothetical protein